MLNFASPPSQAHMNTAFNHRGQNAPSKPPRHPLPSRARSGSCNMKNNEQPNIYPCESTTTGSGCDPDLVSGLPPINSFYHHPQSEILNSPARDISHNMMYGRPPPNPVYGNRMRVPSRVMPQNIHVRRPSYGGMSQAGSDYGYPHSPMATTMHDPFGRITYTPGKLTPKGNDPCINSPWLTQNNMLGDILVECVDCSLFIGRSGALLFFFMMFNVRHRMKILPADTDLRKRKETLRLKKGGLPLPQWPVCYCNNLAMIEPNAILRFLASRLGLYGHNGDPYRDYQADMILDKLAYWRDTLSTLIGEHPECVIINNNCDSPGVDDYLKNTRRSFLHQFETLLESSDSEFFLGDTESWVDPVVFSVLFDDTTFVWSVMTDRARMRERGQRNEEQSTITTESEHWRTISNQAFEIEKRAHENMLDEYPRCQQFINACLVVSPTLTRWIKEHRNLWCGEKPPVATDLVNRFVDEAAYYRKSYLPVYPNSSDVPI